MRVIRRYLNTMKFHIPAESHCLLPGLSVFEAASQLDEIPAIRGIKECANNPSKWNEHA